MPHWQFGVNEICCRDLRHKNKNTVPVPQNHAEITRVEAVQQQNRTPEHPLSFNKIHLHCGHIQIPHQFFTIMPTDTEPRDDQEQQAADAETKMPTEEERKRLEKEAFSAFDEAVASVRASLSKGGHLELVTSEGYRAAQKQLIQTVGRRPAELFLNNWFAKNSAN